MIENSAIRITNIKERVQPGQTEDIAENIKIALSEGRSCTVARFGGKDRDGMETNQWLNGLQGENGQEIILFVGRQGAKEKLDLGELSQDAEVVARLFVVATRALIDGISLGNISEAASRVAERIRIVGGSNVAGLFSEELVVRKYLP